MPHPPQAVPSASRRPLHLLSQTVDGLLGPLRLGGVAAAQVLVLRFVDHALHHVFVDGGFEPPHLGQLGLVVRDLGLESGDELPVHPVLVDAVQHGVHRRHAADVGPQAVQDAPLQIVLLQHHSVVTAVFLPGGAVVIDILFPLDRVGFPGHAPAAAAADEDAGEQVDLLALRGGAGVQAGDHPHQLEPLPGDDGVVGVLHPCPVLGGLLHQIFQLVVVGLLPPLDQHPGVGFIRQDTDHRLGGPLGLQAVRCAPGGVGQAPADLIGQRGEDPALVQLPGDFLRAGPVDAAAVNLPDHMGGVLVDDQMILVIRVLPVAVDRTGPHVVPVFSLALQGAPGFYRDIMAVGVVEQVFQRHVQIVPGAFMGGVDAVIDGDEAYTVLGENLFQIAAGLDVLPAQPGQVLDDHAVNFAGNNVVHHFLEGWAVEQNTAVTVVYPLGNQFNVRVSRYKILNELLLICNAVTLYAMVSGIREAKVCVCLVFGHEKITPLQMPYLPSNAMSD